MGGKSSDVADQINTGMKTFIQFVNEAVQPPADKSVEAPRKIAGHTFAEGEIEKPKLEAPTKKFSPGA